MQFFIHCHFDPDRVDQVQELRDSHLAYIATHRGQIAYGGLLKSDTGALDGICYFLDATSPQAAHEFAAADPYGRLFNQISVQPFEQRIPTPENGLTDRTIAG